VPVRVGGGSGESQAVATGPAGSPELETVLGAVAVYPSVTSYSTTLTELLGSP
jgi:hypothetical protein